MHPYLTLSLLALLLLAVLLGLFIVLRRARVSRPAASPGESPAVPGGSAPEGPAGLFAPGLLVEYCRRRCGTVGGDGYESTALYRREDGALELVSARFFEGDEAEERSVRRVDEAVVPEVYAIIRREDFASWSRLRCGSCLDGASYSLRYRAEDGSFVLVSSDLMPEDGVRRMGLVAECLRSFAAKGQED